MTALTDRIAPNRSIPFLDRGFFRTTAGRALGFLASRSRWFSDLLDAANGSRGS